MTLISPRPADRPGSSLPRLYPIIDIDLCRMRRRSPTALAEACVAGGAQLLQIRHKAAATADFLAACRAIVDAVAATPTTIIINDRADIAVMAGAHGVHVGQDDLSPAMVRRIVGADRVIGLSTHTTEQVDAAFALDTDYVAVGPIFTTATKETGYDPRGLELVRHAAGRGRAVVAIGGITLANAASVLAAGASSVAVISDLLAEDDPSQRVRQFLALR